VNKEKGRKSSAILLLMVCANVGYSLEMDRTCNLGSTKGALVKENLGVEKDLSVERFNNLAVGSSVILESPNPPPPPPTPAPATIITPAPAPSRDTVPQGSAPVTTTPPTPIVVNPGSNGTNTSVPPPTNTSPAPTTELTPPQEDKNNPAAYPPATHPTGEELQKTLPTPTGSSIEAPNNVQPQKSDKPKDDYIRGY
jgi:hypothetical protein